MNSSPRINRLSIALLCGAALLAGCSAEQEAAAPEIGTSKRALTVGSGDFVLDLYTTPLPSFEDVLFPEHLTVVNDVLYFVGFEPTAGVEVWRSDGTEAGTRPLADIVPGNGSAWPENLTSFDGKLFFTADTEAHGIELWVSDGTAAGTLLLADINPGAADSSPSQFFGFNGKLYFTANHPAHGVELWRTDGTVHGTELVVDINPFGSSNPTGFAVLGDALYFAADDGTSGIELWRTDGTAAGTSIVEDLFPGPKSGSPTWLTVAGDKLYFSASDGVVGFELWVTDGTPGNATLIGDLNPSNNAEFYTATSGPQDLFAYGDLLLFSHVSQGNIWRSDGTADGTFELGLRKRLNEPAEFTLFKGEVYFVGDTSATGNEIFKTDGTVAGTALAAEVNVSTQDSNPNALKVFGDHLYFAAGYLYAPGRVELYRIDGTDPVPELVADINPGTPSSEPAELTVIGDTLYFVATNAAVGRELHKTNGTAAGTVLVKDVRPGGTSHAIPTGYTALGDKVVFFSSHGTASTGGGKEPFVTDGTEAGTELLADIRPGTTGSSPSNFVVLGDVAYFAASESASGEPGRELWRTDGTPGGTFRVANIMGNGSALETNPNLVAHNGALYFSATDGQSGREIWRSEGTEATTKMLKDLNPGPGNGSPTLLTSVGQYLYFVAADDSGRELWRTDGTEDGTEMVYDILPGAGGSTPANLTPLGSKLVFTATDGVTGVELWVTDGTPGGTRLLADVNSGSTGTTSSSSFSGFRVVENRLFFAANDGSGMQLWVTDGTPAGTVLLKTPRLGAPAGSISSLVAAGNRLFFIAEDDAAGRELWVSDGTETGTRRVADIRPGPQSSAISQLTAIGTRVVFVADDGRHGLELWTSDGTAEGTTLLRDLMPGLRGSSPNTLTAIAGLVFFSADDGINGFEPWVTDGTAEGTRLVVDLNPGALPSAPELFVRVGSKVYVTANHAMYGREMAILSLSDEPPTITCPEDFTRVAPATGKVVVGFAASAADDGEAPPTISYSVEPGSEFGLGLTTVVATVTDDSGQTATCSFAVRVVARDQTPPTLVCPADVEAWVTSETGGEVSYPAPAADDDSGIAPVLSYSHPSGARFPLGPTVVTVTALDGSSNESTCQFTVTVKKVADEAPEVICPPDITAAAATGTGTEVSYPPAAAFDEAGSDLPIIYSAASGSMFAVGETVVTASATDAAGNTGTCSFKVTVTPAPPAPETGCGCAASGGEPATGALALIVAFGFAALRRRGALSRG